MRQGITARRPYYSSLHKCRAGDNTTTPKNPPVNVSSHEEFPDLFADTGSAGDTPTLSYGELDYTQRKNDLGETPVLQRGWIEACVDVSSNAIVWRNHHQEHMARYDHTSAYQEEPDMSVVNQLMDQHEDDKYEFLMNYGIDEYKKLYSTHSDENDSESEEALGQDECDMDIDGDGDY